MNFFNFLSNPQTVNVEYVVDGKVVDFETFNKLLASGNFSSYSIRESSSNDSTLAVDQAKDDLKNVDNSELCTCEESDDKCPYYDSDPCVCDLPNCGEIIPEDSFLEKIFPDILKEKNNETYFLSKYAAGKRITDTVEISFDSPVDDEILAGVTDEELVRLLLARYAVSDPKRFEMIMPLVNSYND